MAQKLYDWREIRDQFKETLVLGNGASIAVDLNLYFGSYGERTRSTSYLGSKIKKLRQHILISANR
jgi:hypothetical protein